MYTLWDAMYLKRYICQELTVGRRAVRVTILVRNGHGTLVPASQDAHDKHLFVVDGRELTPAWPKAGPRLTTTPK